jgi:hypothetical protein
MRPDLRKRGYKRLMRGVPDEEANPARTTV